MILPNNTSVLRNIKDSFYYNGIEISKENFSIEEFALVCDKINDFKFQIRQEKALNDIRKKCVVCGISYTAQSEIYLLCEVSKNNIYFGLYNNKQNKILPLTKNNFKSLNNKTLFSLSHNLNTTAVFISKGEINKTLIKDTVMLHTFENYIDTIEKSGNSFQNTYELEFINGYKEYILTDEELKKSIIERWEINIYDRNENIWYRWN